MDTPSPLASLPFLVSVADGSGPTERYLPARFQLYIVQLPEDITWVLAPSFLCIYSIFVQALAPMSSLPQILKIPSLDSTIGAVLLGAIFGSMLYGLTVHQTYRYFKLYPKDRLFLKSLVLTILTFETLHTAVWIVVIYRYAITDAFNLVNILRSHWSIPLTFLITGLSVFACQTFYVCRVFLLHPRHRWLLIVPAVISMFGGLGFSLAAGIEAFLAAPFIVGLQKFSWLVSSAYGFDVVTDVVLTSTLVLALHKMRTGFEQTDSVVDTLIMYAINTGLLTSIISIVAFIFAIVIPGNLIYAAVSIVDAKLYANSVLAALNSRQTIDHRLQEDNTIVFNREAFASSVPSTRPLHRMDPESMVYNLHELYPCSLKTSTTPAQGIDFVSAGEGEVGIGI